MSVCFIVFTWNLPLKLRSLTQSKCNVVFTVAIEIIAESLLTRPICMASHFCFKWSKKCTIPDILKCMYMKTSRSYLSINLMIIHSCKIYRVSQRTKGHNSFLLTESRGRWFWHRMREKPGVDQSRRDSQNGDKSQNECYCVCNKICANFIKAAE